MALKLTFNLLVILAVELPIVAYFFGKRKRQPAVMVALMVNIITWVISTIIWLKNPDVNLLYLKIGTSILEAVVYWYFLGRNWKKALLMAVIANVASYVIAQFVFLPDSFFQKKSNMIR